MVLYIPGLKSSAYSLTLGSMYVLYRYLDPWVNLGREKSKPALKDLSGLEIPI